MAAEFPLGPFSGTRNFSEFVGNADKEDTYGFSVSGVQNFSATLTDRSGAADVDLYWDENRNGLAESNEYVTGNRSYSSSDVSVSRFLGSGDYILNISQLSGSDTRYTLGLTITPTEVSGDSAGNRPTQSRDLGTLTNKLSLRDFVGHSDTEDYYRFTVPGTIDLDVLLTGRTGGADLDLYLDDDRDGDVDSGDYITGDRSYSSSNVALNRTLGTGSYVLRVANLSDSDTLYTLEVGPAGATVAPAPGGGGAPTAGGGVSRFYDFLTGTHFYTTNAAEISKRSSDTRYRNETPTFAAAGSDSITCYLNTDTNTYFYAINPAEKAQISQLNPGLSPQSGLGFSGSIQPQAGLIPVYRFYNPGTGTHLYTSSEIEKNAVSTYATWNFEGVGFYAGAV
jgi:hypothetical protein